MVRSRNDHGETTMDVMIRNDHEFQKTVAHGKSKPLYIKTIVQLNECSLNSTLTLKLWSKKSILGDLQILRY